MFIQRRVHDFEMNLLYQQFYRFFGKLQAKFERGGLGHLQVIKLSHIIWLVMIIICALPIYTCV
jgi:hypothetical protein